MDRFYNIQAAGGDPITYWLHQPTHYFEPPIAVVRRHWQGIVESSARARRTCGCTSAATRDRSAPSPPPRSATTPASRYNVEDVRIRVFEDREHAIVTYRGRGVEIEIPTTVTASWHDAMGDAPVVGLDLAAFEHLALEPPHEPPVDPDQPVPLELIEALCEVARSAPNHKRTWPWRFALFTGDGPRRARRRLRHRAAGPRRRGGSAWPRPGSST